MRATHFQWPGTAVVFVLLLLAAPTRAGAQAVRSNQLCVKGDCQKGEGVSVRRDAEGRIATYTGWFKDGKPHGEGSIVFEHPEGRAEMHGYFETGLLQGDGWGTFSTDRYLKRYEGNFRDNAPFTDAGRLRVFDPDGALLFTVEGRIEGFECEGRCTMYLDDGRVLDVCVRNGRPQAMARCPVVEEADPPGSVVEEAAPPDSVAVGVTPPDPVG